MTEAQKQKVVEWIQQGLKLSEIQTRIDSELGVRMTYMEVKMLLADLELKPKDQEPAKTAAPLVGAAPAAGGNREGTPSPGLSSPAPAEPEDEPFAPDAPPPGLGGNVAVSIDTITRPGALVSGKVTFSDQKTADWYLDQMGRLGMAPTEKGYRPSQMDVMAFQNELQNQLAKLGL